MYLWGQNANSIGDYALLSRKCGVVFSKMSYVTRMFLSNLWKCSNMVVIVLRWIRSVSSTYRWLKGYQSLPNCFTILFEFSHNKFINKHRAERASHLMQAPSICSYSLLLQENTVLVKYLLLACVGQIS